MHHWGRIPALYHLALRWTSGTLRQTKQFWWSVWIIDVRNNVTVLVVVGISAQLRCWRQTARDREIIIFAHRWCRIGRSQTKVFEIYSAIAMADCILKKKKKNQYVHIDEMWRFWYLNWQLRMLSLVDVNSPPSVVPPTERPGLAGKVNVHEILLEERGGVIHVTGLRTDVSEHFFTETASQQIVQCWINIMINNNKSWIMSRFDSFQQSILRIESRLVMI